MEGERHGIRTCKWTLCQQDQLGFKLLPPHPCSSRPFSSQTCLPFPFFSFHFFFFPPSPLDSFPLSPFSFFSFQPSSLSYLVTSCLSSRGRQSNDHRKKCKTALAREGVYRYLNIIIKQNYIRKQSMSQ